MDLTKVIGTSQKKTTTFTSSGTFTKINCSSVITDLLVVAGGGGAGNGAGGAGGGGGGGGLRQGACIATAPTTPVVVGAGGVGAPSYTVKATQGGNSTFSTITATGGGRGGNHPYSSGGTPFEDNKCGQPGGSGGGGTGAFCGAGGSGNTPPVSPPQGNNGGTGGPPSDTPNAGAAGGGGGGAGGTGSNGANGCGGNGGNGTADSITGSPVTYAGGGGGATQSPGPSGTSPNGGSGGPGGGGQGSERRACGQKVQREQQTLVVAVVDLMVVITLELEMVVQVLSL